MKIFSAKFSLMLRLTLVFALIFAGFLDQAPKASAASSTIADFENGMDGWNSGTITSGYSSKGSLAISNPHNGADGSTKSLNSALLRGYDNLEFDLNLNGKTIIDGDAAAVVFDQGGWRMASIKNFAKNGQNGWQHVTIPLSAFSGLNKDAGVASMTFRFWNYTAGTYNIDNISLTNGAVTPPTTNGNVIADFNSDMNGFNNGSLQNGFLRLSNPGYGDASTKKILNSPLLRGYKSIEFDINLNGKELLNGDAGTIFFDQGGLRGVTIRNYLNNGQTGWQHVKISFTDFPGLDSNAGVASIAFRFWNYTSGIYDVDNISLSTDGGTIPNTLSVPTNLSATPSTDRINLSWIGNAPIYIIYKNGAELARTGLMNFSDLAVTAGVTYSYFVKATDNNTTTAASSTVSATIPVVPINTTNWLAKSIDSQVASKYWAISDVNQITRLVQANKSLGAKHIAVSINFDNYTLLRTWADVIHNQGLNVWYRGHWNDWDSWEKPEIRNGITSIEYLNRTKNFVINHPELFKAGDAFTFCVESENAAWWTGIDPPAGGGPFTGWESWRAFTRNQVIYANDAFAKIGLGGKVYTNWINMNGWVAWNVLDQYTANTIGQLTLDHIIDWTDDINTYSNALFKGNGNGFYGYDEYFNKWHVPLMAGEWGYSTFNQNIDPNHQKALTEAVYGEFAKRHYMVGVNYWIDIGHASRLFDTDNLLDYNRRPVSYVIEQYYR
jgi:hypothetical protein